MCNRPWLRRHIALAADQKRRSWEKLLAEHQLLVESRPEVKLSIRADQSCWMIQVQMFSKGEKDLSHVFVVLHRFPRHALIGNIAAGEAEIERLRTPGKAERDTRLQ